MHFIKTKLNDFSAAHRLLKNYKGKCNNLHGHNYSISITLGVQSLNEHDFVVDLDVIQTLFNAWICDNLDHSVITSEIDHPLVEFVLQNQQKHYLLPDGKNSTVECLSEHIFKQFSAIIDVNKRIFGDRVFVEEIEVWESKDSSAIYNTHKGVNLC